MPLSRRVECVSVTDGGVCYCHGWWSVSPSRRMECGVCHCHGMWTESESRWCHGEQMVSVSRMVEGVIVTEGGVCRCHGE